MKENFWNNLTSSQKKVAAIVVGVFATLSLALLLYQYVLNKPKPGTKLLENEPSKSSIPKPQSGLEVSNTITQEVHSTQKTSTTANQTPPPPKDEPPAKKIPTIGGYGLMNWQRAQAEQLFEMLYDKKFFDPEKEPHLNQILETFLKANQSYLDKIVVSITQTRNGTSEDIECIKKGCHYHVVKTSYSDNKQLSISTDLLNKFDSLSKQAPKSGPIPPKIKNLLMQIIQEMEVALIKNSKLDKSTD